MAFRQLPVICPQLPAALIGQIGALKKGINIYILLYYWCSMSYSMMADDSISEEKGCHLDRCVAGWDVYPVNVYILACLNFREFYKMGYFAKTYIHVYLHHCLYIAMYKLCFLCTYFRGNLRNTNYVKICTTRKFL